MQLSHDQLQKLLTLLGDSDIQELKLEGDDFRLEVRRNLPAAAPAAVFQAAAAPPQAIPMPAAAPLPVTPSAPPPAAVARPSAERGRGEPAAALRQPPLPSNACTDALTPLPRSQVADPRVIKARRSSSTF